MASFKLPQCFSVCYLVFELADVLLFFLIDAHAGAVAASLAETVGPAGSEMLDVPMLSLITTLHLPLQDPPSNNCASCLDR